MPIIVDKTSLCDICSFNYQPERVPVILPCGHTLCKDCSCLMTKCHLCRHSFEQDDVLRIHVDFERLPAIMTDMDSSLGELNLNEFDASKVDVDAMAGLSDEIEVPSHLAQASTPLSESVDDSVPTQSPTDAAITSEVLMIAMEDLLRESMEQQRKELKKLKKLARRQSEERALAQALAQSYDNEKS